MPETVLDINRQKEAKKYSRIRHRLLVVDILIGGLFAVAWLIFGWSQRLRDYLLGFTTNEWLLVAGF